LPEILGAPGRTRQEFTDDTLVRIRYICGDIT